MQTGSRGLLVCSFVLFLLLMAGGAWFFNTQEKQLRHEVDVRLHSIARLKVDQLVQWRQEQVADAQIIMENPFVGGALVQCLTAPDPAVTEKMLLWFQSFKQHHQFSDVLLVAPDGTILLSLSGATGQLEGGALPALHQACTGGTAVLSDLHQGHLITSPHQDTIAPVFAATPEGKQAVGVLILRNDASRFLYPMIQNWPEPSRSGETVLVRRDGDHILFLNELRHRKDSALQLRMPFSQPEMPEHMAVQGVQGLVEGPDYRGVPVLAVLNPVPGTTWFMITKIDTEEALAHWQTCSLLILGLILGVGTTLFAGLGLIWQRYRKKHFQAAYHAEARYRTTLMSVGDGVIASDTMGRVTLMNPVAEVLTGWNKEEALGRPVSEVFDVLNEDTRQPVENPVDRVLRDGQVVGLGNHTVLITPEGMERPIADSGAPIFDEKGQITGVVLVFRDQSEEREAEARLFRTNALLERAEEMARMGWWEFDFQRRIVFSSSSAQRIYGHNADYWTIKDIQAIPLPQYRPALDQAMQALVETGQPYDVEFTIRRPSDGAIVDIHSQAQYDPKINKAFGVIQDITERKRAESALRESEARYRSLFQANRAVIWLVDTADGSIVDANAAASAYYGWSREELLSMRVSDINTLSWEDLKVEMEDVRAIRRQLFEFKHRLADGTLRDVEVFSGPISVDGRNCIYSIIYDITERKQAEEAREHLRGQLLQSQRLESVGRLAGGIAHDLNNMLSPILGYSDMLLIELPEGDRRRGYVQQISLAGTRARDLVRQLLAFGRKQTLVVELADLNQVITGFLTLLQRTVREDIVFETVLQPGLPSVRIDCGQIEQVLMNLAINAQDAMPEGGKIILETGVRDLDEQYAFTHTEAAPGRYVVLIVSDTGTGMSAEVREQIFSPYFTTKEKGKGTGLGLAMVYGIVKQHHGHIWVYSEPDQGTTFKVYLPAAEAASESLPREPVTTEPESSGSGVVMVVEDNEMVRQLVVDILSHCGYSVLEAEGGAECLRMLEAMPKAPDLLLTDVVMPGMNGKALYQQAVHLVPQLKVLYMSGYTENVIASQGVLEEGLHFIQKPFSSSALTAKVRQVLES